MASSINASLTAGLVQTADTSGIINLQSNGTTVASVSSTGVAVTGTLSSTGNTTLGDASTDTLNVGNGNLVTDASGNVGIGVTPSAWGSTYKAVQVGIGSSLAGVTNDVNLNLTNNAYYNGTNWIYLANSPSERYRLFNGEHQWFNAASGTAGNAVSYTQAMTLDASSNLSVTGGVSISGSVVAGGYSGGELTFPETTADAYSGISTQATGDPILFFDHRATSNTGSFRWRNGSGGGNTLMTLDASGGLKTLNTIGVGNATPSASGAGITFPATQSASTDANTLDDYEEGTWTPTIQGGTTAGTYTYEAARTGGKYTKVGNVVTVWASFRIGIITTAGTGALKIGGLPFSSGSRTASSWDNSDSLMVNLYASGVNVSAATYPPPLMGALSDGVTSFDVFSYGKNYAVATVIGDLSGADWIYTISGSYTTT